MFRLNEHTKKEDLDSITAPLIAGYDMGIISEAGCAAVADPGALLVERAHTLGVRVAPLVGPCSMILALMGSGLSGQSFAFHGYLPVEKEDRRLALINLERRSRENDESQIFIETPYRNQKLFQEILESCDGQTRLCIGMNLTLPGEFLLTRSVADWRKEQINLGKDPAVFVLQGSPLLGPRTISDRSSSSGEGPKRGERPLK